MHLSLKKRPFLDKAFSGTYYIKHSTFFEFLVFIIKKWQSKNEIMYNIYPLVKNKA